MPLCSDCKRNHYNSSFKTEEITTWYAPSNGTKHCIDYIQKEQKPADNVSREEYVKRFKALCDAYEIKLPNREYDIYHLCDDLSKLSMDSGKHKSAEWSEEDEKMLDKVCCLISPGTILNASDADYCIELKQWIVSLQERILKLYRTQPKQEWSEEDKQKLNRIYEILGYAADDKGFLTSKRIIGDKEAIELQDFLKSLSERFNLQPKQEWSEEDETAFGDLMWCIKQAAKSAKDENDMGNIWFAENWLKNRLKSLRPKKNISYGELPLVPIDYVEELDTDFEKQVGAVIASAMNREHRFTSKYIKWTAQRLIECAKDKQNSEEEHVSDNKEWSEKDEKMIERLITRLNWITYNTRTDGTSVNITFFDEIDWLKDLRLNLKKRNEDAAKLCSNEWSEEDENAITTAIRACRYMTENFENSTKQYEDAIERLKSLRPQPKKNDMITPNKKFFQWIYDRLVNVHNEDPNVDYMTSFKRRIEEFPVDEPSWKPSEEHFQGLRRAITKAEKGSDAWNSLTDLYEQLKKL